MIKKEWVPSERSLEICQFLFDIPECITDIQAAIVNIYNNVCINNESFEDLLKELFRKLSKHESHEFPKDFKLLEFCVDCLAGLGAYRYLQVVDDAEVLYNDKVFKIAGFTATECIPNERILNNILGNNTGIRSAQMYQTVANFVQTFIFEKLPYDTKYSTDNNALSAWIDDRLKSIAILKDSRSVFTDDSIFFILSCGEDAWVNTLANYQCIARTNKFPSNVPEDDRSRIFSDIPKVYHKSVDEWIRYIHSQLPKSVKEEHSDICEAIVYGYLDVLKRAIGEGGD